jgi:hypothetical protein
MSLRNRPVLPRLVLPIILSSLAVLAGCGSSTPSATPPPSGSFSKSDLNGTYVFSTSGSDGSGYLFTMAGTITADGNGGISGGTIDINDSDIQLSAPVQLFGQAISASSNYTVGVDGRGKINLVNTPLGTIVFDFVLNSSSGGLITEFDANGTGSGTIEAQSAAITQSQLEQSFAFSLSGFDLGDNLLGGAGAFTLGSDGTIASGGVYDFNDAQLPYVGQPLSGSVTLGSGGSSGTAQLSTVFGLLNFNFYVVDASHLKLIETDPLPYSVLSGDVFLQASIPTGTLVFTMAGYSTSSGPLALGGFMTSSGAGQTTNGLEDANIGGTVSSAQLPFTLNYTAPVSGRSTMTLTNFAGPGTFAIYPSSGGLLMEGIDSTAVASGIAYAQTNGALGAPPQGYGLNFTGLNSNGPFEVDDIAEFVTSSSTGPTGLVDENDQGTPQSPQAISSNVSVFSQDDPVTGRGEAQFANSSGILFDVIFYTIDGSNSIFIETDTTQVSAGMFQLQNSGAKAAAGTAHPINVHPIVMVRPALRHRTTTVHPK